MTKEIDAAAAIYIKLAVTGIKLESQFWSHYREIVTAEYRIFVRYILIPGGLIKNCKPVVYTGKICVDKTYPRSPLPVIGAGVVYLQEIMPGVCLVNIINYRESLWFRYF